MAGSRQQELLQLAHRTSELGALVWTVSTDRLEVDDAAARLFGLRRGTFGSTFRALLDRVRDESRDAVATAVEHVLTGGMLLDVEMMIDLPDGTPRHLALRGTVLHDATGQPEHVIAAIRDVSREAALREELAEVKRELATRDEELRRMATAMATNARVHANLLARTSHEIRTRLDAILGMSRIALDGELSDEQRELIATVRAQGEGMVAIVADCVDMSATTAELDEGPVDLRALVVDLSRLANRPEGSSIEIAIDETVPPRVLTDAARLRRILLNLLGGTHGDAARIEASARPLGGKLHELAIAVHGIDTPPDRVAQLFDGSTTSVGGGFGLSISAKLVGLLGGKIAAEPRGSGVAVRLTIPVEEVNAIADEVVVDLELGKRHPLRVLVAEDNVLNRKVAGAFLGKLGYAPRFAVDGKDALAAIERERFDVVLMDVDMPVMDGLEAAREIRERIPRERAPRLVAVTANALPRDRAACLEAGYDDYLSKPLRIEQLAAQLAKTQPVPELPIDPATVDVAVLDNLDEALGPTIVAELVATYDSDARELLDSLETAAHRGDATALARAAHTLKSISASLGAVALPVICDQLETQGREGSVHGADSLVERAARELAHVRVALTQHVARPRG